MVLSLVALFPFCRRSVAWALGNGLFSIFCGRLGVFQDDTPVGKDKFFNLVCCHLLCCLLGFGFVLFWLGIWDFEVFVEMRE